MLSAAVASVVAVEDGIFDLDDLLPNGVQLDLETFEAEEDGNACVGEGALHYSFCLLVLLCFRMVGV